MKGTWVELFLAFFCFGLFLYLPGRSVESYLAQLRTTEFVPLEATVTRSEVYSYHVRRGGTRYAWAVTYSIDTPVGPIASNRQAFTSGADGSESSMRDLVEEHPVGSSITVYARPDDVSISVLRRGLSLGELSRAGMSATLLATGFCFCISGIARAFSRQNHAVAGGAYTSITPSKATLSLESESPLSYAATFFCIAIAFAIPISGVLGGRGIVGSAAVGSVMVILLLVFSYRIYLARLRARWSDRYVLIFDFAAARVILPRRSSFAQDPIPASRVSGFEITEHKEPKSGPSYRVSILYRELREKEREHIRTFANKDHAQSLMDWCKEQLARCRGTTATTADAPALTPRP